jgi:Protein of unknown function (DUF3375)
MTPEKLSIYFETSPAVRLLQAVTSPFIVCFLHERFKRGHRIVIAHSELLPALAAYQESLHEAGFDGLRDKPDEYLRDWSSPAKRWLHRFLEAGRSEPMYQLTPHSEAVIEFVERALQQDLTFVGTESRLRLVMQTLEELLIGASNDPAMRLKYLRDEQARIVAEIEDIEQNGCVKTFAPTRVREQFALAVQMLKQLQGDFRAVEEKFKEITRQVQQRQMQGLDSRDGILGDALGAEDELKRQDQGVTFFEVARIGRSASRAWNDPAHGARVARRGREGAANDAAAVGQSAPAARHANAARAAARHRVAAANPRVGCRHERRPTAAHRH